MNYKFSVLTEDLNSFIIKSQNSKKDEIYKIQKIEIKYIDDFYINMFEIQNIILEEDLHIYFLIKVCQKIVEMV